MVIKDDVNEGEKKPSTASDGMASQGTDYHQKSRRRNKWMTRKTNPLARKKHVTSDKKG